LGCLMAGSVASAQEIVTFAGTGTAGYNGDLIPATTAQLNGCIGLTVDPYGTVYISDLGNNRVRMVDLLGDIHTLAGKDSAGYWGDGGLAINALLNSPRQVSTDAFGNVYIADAGNNCIRKVSSTGIITTVAGMGAAGFNGDGGAATDAVLNYPCGVAVDTGGNIFIADTYNNCIRKVNKLGIILTIAGLPGSTGGYSGDGGNVDSAQFNFPASLFIDINENLYVADMLNERIRKMDSGGTASIVTVAGCGVAGSWGDGGLAIDAALSAPNAASLDQDGNLYISDQYNNKIRKVFANTGVIVTVAGNGTGGYAGDGGSPLAAELSSPQGVACDGAGNIYIADFGNQRVREVVLRAGVAQETQTGHALVVAPNPVTDGLLGLRLTANGDFKVKYAVTDVVGRVVAEFEGRTNIPTVQQLNLQPGIYDVTATTENGVNHCRFVMQ
jgi:trimeric autotransporter adhesin